MRTGQSPADLLNRLGHAGIRLWLDGERLRFDAPEGIMTPELRDELRSARDELITHLRRVAAIEADRPPLAPRSTSEPPPLAFNQEGLWFVDQMGAGAAYNIRFAERLIGRLDVVALRRAFEAVVERHEALRTTFPSVDGRPVERIESSVELPFEVIDLGGLDAAVREAEVRRLASQETTRRFDLEHGPLFRVRLYRLADNNHVLFVAVHHIVFDGWSTGVLKHELGVEYRAIVEGATSPLPRPPVQFADFAVWQRNWLCGDVLAAMLEYWTEQLSDLPVIEIPADRTRPPQQTFEGADLRFAVPRDLCADLTALGQESGATPAMTFLAAYAALLARYTGQDEVVVGSPIANRTNAEVEGLLGFFANTVVFRIDLSGDPSFTELLERVKQVSLGAYDHQDIPFERLVDELNPARDPSRNPLFQITFAFQNTPMQDLVLRGLTVESFDLGAVTTRFDLELYLNARDGAFQGRLVYNKRLFELATAERLQKHYVNLLAAIARQSDTRLSLLPILDEEERRRAIVEWNDTRTAYPHDKTVDRLFEEQVARTPHAEAVSYAGVSLTYDVLERRANQLAHYLRKRGIVRGSLVAICMERSTDFIVGLLGILKAGGAYVPLDADYPKQRLALMLADAKVPVLLTNGRTRDDLPEHPGETVCLDREGPVIAQERESAILRDASAEDLAYVIYTSGSTGMPKGVCIPHRGITRLVLETDYCQLEPSDRIAQASNASFDAATFEIWGGLLNGATVIGISKEVSLSARQFAEALREDRITTLFLTTALFNQASLEIPDIFGGLRHLLFGGEMVDPRRVRAVLAEGRPQRLLHVYGPTECTTFSTWYEVQELPEDALTVPIGRPIANSTMYVLDRSLNPVPVGVLGELYLGGDGLAVRYHERPELTAETFIPDPFAGSPAAKMYRTGDVVRYRPDGAIEFVGRNDHQVKLRGFRIELGEIEAVIKQYEAVSTSVVTVQESGEANKRLVAYVVPKLASDHGAELDRASEDRVDEWQSLHDELIYRDIEGDPNARRDAPFNSAGWLSTYTGESLSPEDVHEHVDRTIDRMLDGACARVLEIGCRTGLLLFAALSRCRTYWATDFSRVALDYVGRQLEAIGSGQADVRLMQRTATDFEGIDENSFDLAVLDSVVQHYPTMEYLDTVLDRAIRAVVPGGRVLIGDVRSLPLLEVFQTSVQWCKAGRELTVGQLRQRIRQSVLQEQELVIDPEYFLGLQARNPKVSHVEILLKRGHATNELTKYRYDVILHVSSERPSFAPDTWVDWEQTGLALESVRRRLDARPRQPLAIRAVPNGRLREDLAIVAALAEADRDEPIGRVRSSRICGIDPEALWDLGSSSGYSVTLQWSDSGPGGRFDVVFTPQPAEGDIAPIVVTPVTAEQRRSRDLRSCGTDPLRARTMSQLIPGLREHIAQHLPEYMIPSAFVLMDALPLTPNGKVDRQALPEPDSSRPGLSTVFEAPRNAVEGTLCAIWAELLGLERIGIHDDFFEMGGHSLLATQVMSRIRERFGCDVALRRLFDHATVAGLAAVVQGEQTGVPEAVPIASIPRDGDLPLSFAQQRLWFLDQLEPGGTGYNAAMSLRLRGALDATALRCGLDELVRRHETLRTAFRSEEGVPRQCVMDPTPADFEFVDLTTVPAEIREDEAQRHARGELERPFDLAAGRPLRARLIRLAAEDHVLLLTVHHIVFDGWSLGVLHRELGALYATFARGETAQLPSLGIQYADFAVWQRQWLSGPVWERQASYWRAQLADATPMDIPTDRPRPAIQTFCAARERIVLPARLSDAIDKLGRQLDATTFMTLLAAFNVMLRRYSGQGDIVVGSPIANRNRIEIEHLIGFFVNSLVMRTDLSGNPTFCQLVRRVRNVALEAYQNQDIPFEHLVEELRPERDLSRNPIFQILFAVHESGMENLELPGIEVTRFERGQATTRLDLEVHVFRSGESATVTFLYNTDLFDRSTIERMARQYERLLEDIIANPERTIDDLRLMSDADRRRVLVELNDSAASYAESCCVHEFIEAQAERDPEAVAVILAGGEHAHCGMPLTYRELNRRSNRLAHRLRSKGVAPGSRVGLLVDRGPGILVGMLGILKAGGAYVPLDVANPKERLAFILDDTSIETLVSDSVVSDRVGEFGGEIILLDDGDGAFERYSDANPDPVAKSSDLAYVIYTSGSTGRPKGVEVTHRNLVNFLESMRRAPGFAAEDVLLAVTTPSFDIAALELFLPLVAGGSVVIAAQDAVSDGEQLQVLLDEHAVTVMQGTPATWQLLVHSGWGGKPGLKMLCGGEALPRPLAGALLQRGGELWNMYGPTETTVWSAVAQVEDEDEKGAGPMPIGRPIANTFLYVLDRQNRPVPEGVVGELWIGGDGVARGYLNRPELTAERFMADPFRDESGARMYRTGDLVRWDSRGRLLYLGRIDDQVKLRGFRIELGEIESVLAEHPDVEQAAAIVRGQGENRHLVAFAVAREGGQASPARLREFLRGRLPDYMVPSAIAFVDALPLGASGKIDRKRLAAIETGLEAEARTYTAPRGPEEEAVVAAFSEVLGVEVVGAHENFFELGGHSLLATRLVSRIRSTLRVELPLRDVFEHPTVAGLATRVRAARQSIEAVESAAPIRQVPRDRDLELSFAQRRLWVLDQMGTGAAYNMSHTYRLRGTLDRDALEGSLRDLISRHEVLRTRFDVRDGHPYQIIDESVDLTLEATDLSSVPESDRDVEIQALIARGTDRAFDLSAGPLIRARLVDLGSGEYVLLLNVHHIVTDAWSIGLITRDLAALYEARLTGEPPRLPSLSVHYADFAAWQVERMQGETLERQLSYWKNQLSGDLPVLNLPTDRPRPPLQTFHGAARQVALSRELSEAVSRLARKEGVTVAMVMLAAFQVLLSKYTGQEDVVIGSPIANRTRSEIEDLIGIFVNSLVLRTDLSGDPTFSEVLRRVQKLSLDAYDHQDLPFERLVYELNPERDLAQNPLFQVVFAMQNVPRTALELPGLVIEDYPAEVRTIRTDLELFLIEQPSGFRGMFVYNVDLFDASTVDRMATHLTTLLEGAVSDPGKRIGELPLLDPAERHRIVAEWNETAADYPDDIGIHRLFEARVAESPDLTALLHRGREWTYRELESRANRVAHALLARGVRRNSLVGLCFERTPEMIVGMLGILKAGGAYVPIDPTYPRDRVAFMLADSGVETLLTQAHLRDALPPHAADVLCLDADWPSIEAFPADNPAVDVSPDDLAYAIYTSGSTGTPKCALLQHRGLCNVPGECARVLDIRPGSRVLQFASLSFDAATYEIVGALANGATLVLGDPDELLPGPDLLAFLKRHAIEIMTLPPTALAVLPVDELPALRTVAVAGEPCFPDLVERWAPGRRFFNLYGPTETTIWATRAQLRPGEPVHIGRPIANTRVYILDRHLEPVPAGVPGELCIGGVGVARGYRNRAELTAERFVPDPFCEEPDARLYRTQDLARFRADGNIEFLGRIDHQVKVRGYRIELGEIEAAIDRHPSVRESVVLAREDAPGDRRLVAYITEAPAAERSGSDLGEKVRQDDHVSHWETLYEQSYDATRALDAGMFNISGWNSSYTNDPIPAEEMRKWVDGTVEAILAHHPQRVLELGCGNGLLLFRVAPHCEQYLGCDFAQAALDYIEGNLGVLGEAAGAVTLRRQRADDFTGIGKGAFDTIVLNSVVQYFPAADYLLRVLEGAIDAVGPGGRIFIGDVRSLPLFRAFHTSVQAFRAEPELSAVQLRQRVDHHLNQDQELVVEPELFVGLQRLFPRVTRVSIRPKVGGYDNELSRFRYDVTLHLDEPAVETPAVRWLDWDPGRSNPEALEHELAGSEPEVLGIRGVPNARVLADVFAAERLDDDRCPSTAGALIEEARKAASGIGVDPDRFVSMSQHLPYDVLVDWAAPRHDGAYDVLFVRRNGGPSGPPRPVAFPRATPRTRPWANYTNDPLRGRRVRQLVPELRRHLQATLPEFMVPSAFVVLDRFPTTPSGKVDRKTLPAPDAVRPESAGAFALPRNKAEEILSSVWARVLGIERIGIHDNFFELGGDSILSIQVVAAAREAGLRFGARDLFQHQTVAELAAAAQLLLHDDADQGPVTGPMPLTPIELWFLNQHPRDAHHFNQALFLESTEVLDSDVVREGLQHLIEHHDALRSRLRRDHGGWIKEIVEPGVEVPLETVEVPALDARARRAFVEREAARVQASLDLEHGPLLRLALFRTPGIADHLLFVIHHLAVDAVSWPILVQDLQSALDSLRRGQPVVFPPKSTSVTRWAEALAEHAATPKLLDQAAYWLELPLQDVGRVPRDHDDGDNTVSSVGTATVSLSESSTTALLQRVPAAYGTRINDVLLTALARTLGRWTGSECHIVDVEGHGRDPFADGLDPSRTVGWFTSIYPVLLAAPAGQPPGDALKETKQRLHSLPDGGRAHGLVRWVAPDAALSNLLRRIPPAEIAFNYLGRFDGTDGTGGGLLRPSDWPCGPMRSPRMRRAHLLEINAVVQGGRFAVTWAFSRAVHREETVKQLAGAFLDELTSLIEHCESPEAGGYTPSDFGKFGWDQDDLDDILSEAGEGK